MSTVGPETIEVLLPSGARFEVLTEEERDYLELQATQYLETFTLQNVSDAADLDAIVRKEMLVWRWEIWLSREADWSGHPIDARHYGELSKKTSVEIRQLKEQLEIDKKARRRTTGDGSVPEFIGRILTAAKLLGIHRSKQLDRGLELCMNLRALATVYKNSDDEERRMMRCTAKDIVEWVIEVFEPEMQAIDQHFQENEQQMWVGKL